MDAPSLVPDSAQHRDTGGAPADYDRVVPQSVQASQGPPSQQVDGVPRESFLRLRILGIERNPRELVLRFDAATNLAHFTRSSYAPFTRTYRELTLYALALALGSPSYIVPAIPFPACMPSSSSDAADAAGEFDLNALRAELSTWLTRVLAQPPLRDSLETRALIEAEYSYIPAQLGSSDSTPGARRRLTQAIEAHQHGVGQLDVTMANMGIPGGVLASSAHSAIPSLVSTSSKGLVMSRSVYDDDELLVGARAEVTRLELQFADAAEAAVKRAKARDSLAQASLSFSHSLLNLASVEALRPESDKRGMPDGLRCVAETLGGSSVSAGPAHGRRKLGLADGDARLSQLDHMHLIHGLSYQSVNARAAKEGLLARNALVEEHHIAQKATVARKREAEQLRAARNMRMERIEDKLAELEEAHAHEVQLAQHLRQISTNLHGSLQTHSRQAHADLSTMLSEHVTQRVNVAKRSLEILKAARQEVADVRSGARKARAVAEAQARAHAQAQAAQRATIQPQNGFAPPPIGWSAHGPQRPPMNAAYIHHPQHHPNVPPGPPYQHSVPAGTPRQYQGPPQGMPGEPGPGRPPFAQTAYLQPGGPGQSSVGPPQYGGIAPQHAVLEPQPGQQDVPSAPAQEAPRAGPSFSIPTISDRSEGAPRTDATAPGTSAPSSTAPTDFSNDSNSHLAAADTSRLPSSAPPAEAVVTSTTPPERLNTPSIAPQTQDVSHMTQSMFVGPSQGAGPAPNMSRGSSFNAPRQHQAPPPPQGMSQSMYVDQNAYYQQQAQYAHESPSQVLPAGMPSATSFSARFGSGGGGSTFSSPRARPVGNPFAFPGSPASTGSAPGTPGGMPSAGLGSRSRISASEAARGLAGKF